MTSSVLKKPNGVASTEHEQDPTQLLQQMQEIVSSFLKPTATYLIARLGIADNLKASGGHAKSARQLAQELEVRADMLYRCLRWAVVVGLLKEEHLTEEDAAQSTLDSRGFVIAPLGKLLEEDHPFTMKPHALQWGRPFCARSCEGEHLYSAMKQGTSGIAAAFGEGSDYMSMMLKDPEEKDICERTMSAVTQLSLNLALSYAFGAHTKVVDVGGSRGALIQAILSKYPTVATGISFDLPEVVTPCKVPQELVGRMEFVGGSFFEKLPKELDGADCMTLKHVLHDWSDSQCIDILRHCADSLAPGGQLLIIEQVLPETIGLTAGTTHLLPYAVDMLMMGVTNGGQERTLSQWTELFRAAGLNEPKVAAKLGDMACLVTSVA